ncbi:hypothetical protein O7627_07375 [Solwaraspora sp. WMMD1047]|uniref:VC0807 family protein n=1 Tax=Solwaraspora sp. WMMD1047 TaxID=3016102 RepID=UPI002416BBC8|nr:VC0807 family protein [Solwaraspora sp. WMMD1047]MDG4829125.1 hypothetical protein [Solwaraspora sp. WMMD1047]
MNAGQYRTLRGFLLEVAVDTGIPTAGYYLLRAFGVGMLPALLATVAFTAALIAYRMVVRRRVDKLALTVLGILLVSTALSFLTGSVRFMFAKNTIFPALIGAGFLISARGDRPAALVVSRPLLEGLFGARQHSWDDLWRDDARFRRIWRVSTVIQGSACVADAVARFVLAYTLPVDLVPGLSMAQRIAIVPLVLLITNVYQTRAGLWRILYRGRPTLSGTP